MRTLLVSAAALVLGYVVGLFGGILLVSRFSSNAHDRSVEAAMTSAFVVGPIVAILSLLATLAVLFTRRG